MTDHVGFQVRRWRDASGLTQAQLAERVGVQLITVSRWERGATNPTRKNLEAIRQATGVETMTPEERAPIYRLAERVAELERQVEEMRGTISEYIDRDSSADALRDSGDVAAAKDARRRASSGPR